MFINKLGVANETGQKTILEKLQSTSILNLRNNNDVNNNKNTPAATYKQSTSNDYAGKKLNPVQKNILQLQDQIKSIKTNDKMDSETKDDLIKSLNSQIADLQKSLNNDKNDTSILNTNKRKSSQNDVSSNNEKNPSNDKVQNQQDNIASLTKLGTQIDQLSTTNSTVDKISNEKKLAKSELNFDLNNPDEQLRLRNKSVINSRESNIEKLNQSLQTVQSLQKDLNNNISPQKITINNTDNTKTSTQTITQQIPNKITVNTTQYGDKYSKN